MKKIYLSAPGLVCCAGKNKEELYEACIKGDQSGITPQEWQGAGIFPTGIITWELPEVKTHTGNNRIIKIIDAAIEQIRPEIEKAIAKYGTDKIGVCLGSCDNGSESSLIAHKEFLTSGAFPKDYDIHFQSASFPAEYIAEKFKLSGPVMTVATACASGASAIIRGAELIRSGFCNAVIAGGADIVSETVFLGFHALEAVSDSLTNPFSKNRKGINLGEGAAFFLLDTEQGDIELLGYGESADAYHMTAPGEDGAGPAKAMKAALQNANIKPEQIGYVNLHGTGTPLNDQAEANAIKTVFGDRVVPASSTKPIMGHTLGAAGALESAVCWIVCRHGTQQLPMHCWDGEKDEQLVFHPSTSGCENTSISMNNSFAFGGCNVSLILGKV